MKKFSLLFLFISLYFSAFSTIDTLNVDITSDTTLTADTIFVGQKITVETSKTLTIAPGVVVIFSGDTTHQYNEMQNTTAGYFYIKGNLNAAGLYNNRITFTKADSLNWGGIFFSNLADSSVFKYCDINFANGIDSIENFNYTGAISARNGKLKIYSCNINNNNSAIYLNEANIAMFNNIITNNNIAITCDSSDFTMINSTITENAQSISATTNSSPTITNTIIYGNTANTITGTPNITYSNIEGGFAGTGNINSDPNFVTNYKLSACSNSINVGSSNTTILYENTDYFGNNRIFWTLVDLGAYEHQYEHSYYSSDTVKFSLCADSVQIDNIWFNNDTIFTHTFYNSPNYCDSTLIFQITKIQLPTLTFSPADTLVCLDKKAWIKPILTPNYDDAVITWTSNDSTETLGLNGNNVFAYMRTREKQYYINVDIQGCVIVDTANIGVHQEYVINLGADTSACRGYNISAGAGQNGYLWSNGETTANISILNTGIYSVTVTDTNNCRYNNSVDITILPTPIVNFADDTLTLFSDGNTIIGGAGLGYDNYLWSNGETTPYINIDAADLAIGNHTYWLYCSFISGCEASDTIIVKILDKVNVNELNTNKEIKLYPNPSNGNINITGEFVNKGNVYISVSDISGKIISTKNIGDITILSENIDLKGLEKGFYFINIKHNNTIGTYKISIQ